LYVASLLTTIVSVIADGQTLQKNSPVVGLLTWSSCNGPANAPGLAEFGELQRGLADYGYTPGENLTIRCRSASGRIEGFSRAAAELVGDQVDVIIATSTPAADAAENASRTIPIVAISGYLFGSAFSAPGYNLTGLVDLNYELTGKRLELLSELAPGDKIGVLGESGGSGAGSGISYKGRITRAANLLGLKTQYYEVGEVTELPNIFAQMKSDGMGAVLVLPSLLFRSEAARIAALAANYRLPTMGGDRRLTEAGCLMAYSANYPDMERRLAHHVDRILKGAKPGDIPVEEPARFWLSINLRTAHDLGIDVPLSLMISADEVIE
jgi:putative ABC transport system substrate-binding protein